MKKTPNELLAKIAQLYYEKNMTQKEVSEKIGISRSRISRLLKMAHEEGIIEVKINYPLYSCLELERKIEEKYGLLDVAIIPDKREKDLKKELGSAAARILDNLVKDGSYLGIAMGRTIQEVINHLEAQTEIRVTTVQMTGSLLLDSHKISSSELCRRAAILLNGDCYFLNAPARVDNKVVRDAILSDTQIQEVFLQHTNIDIAIFGVGSISPQNSSLLASVVDSDTVEELKEMGITADLCSSFLDRDGNKVKTFLDERMIAISSENLKTIPKKILVAGGLEKLLAIQSTLHGQYVDILVTDSSIAKKLLEDNI